VKSLKKDNLGNLALNSSTANNPPELFKKDTVDLEKIFLEDKNEFGKLHEQDTAGGGVLK